MNLNFIQIGNMLNVCKELQEVKMPFKLSLILAKNISALKEDAEEKPSGSLFWSTL